jgi:hypothetical protein
MTQYSQLQLFHFPESGEQTQLNAIEKTAIAQREGTFVDNLKLPIHRWFRYSAGFSAAWVEKAIVALDPQTILDPFVGSGTVCIAADKLGRISYGIEAHPFVYKIAQGKLGLVFQALRRVTSPNCKMCFIVGDSAPYGVYVPVEQWLEKLAIAAGFKCCLPKKRTTISTGKDIAQQEVERK